MSLQTARADMLVFCCSNTGLGLDPGSLSQSVPSLRPSPSTGLASSQLQAWQFLLRRLPTAQRRLSTSASHCPVSLLTCHAADSDAVLCCAVRCCPLCSVGAPSSCCHDQAECPSTKCLACRNKLCNNSDTAHLVYLRLCAWLHLIPSVCADMQAFKAMMRRESTLIQRTLFVYIFKAVQVSMPCGLTYSATQILFFLVHEHCGLQSRVRPAFAFATHQNLLISEMKPSLVN